MRTFVRKYEVTGKCEKRIVLLSDIHYYKNTKFNMFQKLTREIIQLNPDIICIAGDIIDDTDVFLHTDMNPLRTFLEDLGMIAPVMIVLGNHDIRTHKGKKTHGNKLESFLKEIPNVYLLSNKEKELDEIFFMGYEVPHEYYRSKEKKKELFIEGGKVLKSNPYRTSILLLHTPMYLFQNYYRDLSLGRYDLILCGHTHNGLIPGFISFGNFGLVSPEKKLFPTHVRGKMKKENTTLIVSGGITKLSYSSLFFQFLNFLYGSEITVIDIKKEKDKK